MARILILSSWVAHGHVGLSAAVPVLQRLGHEVTQLPMTLLSNHPGWPHVAGAPMPVAQLCEMRDALDRNGWLSGLDTVLTGYMPSADHVGFAVETLQMLCARMARPRIVVDPVLGDLPKGLYVPPPVAHALRESLVPLADCITPNLFELALLAGREPKAPFSAEEAAQQVLQSAPLQEVLVTSAPAQTGSIATLSLTHLGLRRWEVPAQEAVPNGVGDVFSALIAAGLPVGQALGHLGSLIKASLGAPHLQIAESGEDWVQALPVASGFSL